MSRPRLLITGGTGLLGINWAVSARQVWHVTRIENTRRVTLANTDSVQLDLLDVMDTTRAIAQLKPDMVVHTAGLTNVEQCEADPDLAMALNCQTAQTVATACHAHGIPLVAISTDHLFGKHSGPYTEDTPPTPLNVYAASKAAGERAVLEANPNAIVARTNFFGWGPSYKPSFSDTILAALRKGQPLSLFEDVTFSPILMERLIEIAHDLVSHKKSGVYNLVGDDSMSKYAFGRQLAQHFELPIDLIAAGKLADKPELVARPYEMTLDTRLVRSVLGAPVGTMRSFIDTLLTSETTAHVEEIRAL